MTTRDTPEAALAAALHREGIYCDGMAAAMDERCKEPFHRADAAAILAALDREGYALMTVPSPGESAGYDLEAEIARLRKIEEAAQRLLTPDGVLVVSGNRLADLRAALAPSEPHKSGDPHQYQTQCLICGEQGYLHVSLKPQTVP